MQQMHEDPDETKAWEAAKRQTDGHGTAQRNEDPTETDEWEQKKKDTSGPSA